MQKRNPIAGFLGIAAALAAAAALAQAQVAEKVMVTPQEMKFAAANPALPAGLATTVLAGSPSKPGVYVMRVRLPANFKVPPHTHPDRWRTVTVISGTLYFGYGNSFDEGRLRPLPPGSFFSEPKDEPHFAMTRGEEVVVQVTAEGPSGTIPVDK